MSLTAAASGFVAFLLSVAVIQSQDDWGVTYTSSQICALKGSTVEIPCSYRYPSRINDRDTTVKEKLWFAKGSGSAPVDLTTDSDYTGRVEYIFQDNNNCSLRIKDLKESDSAEYKFRFITNQEGGTFTGEPGVTLSVTDLQVQVGRSSAQAELRCHHRCNVADHTSYVWYNNGQRTDEETSSHIVSVEDSDSYSCAVTGYEDYSSPPVYAPKLPSMSVSPSGDIEEGSSVTLTCSSEANPAATYTWYKKNGIYPVSKEPQLVFGSIQSSDSGEYYCAAENELGRRTSEFISVNVKYAPKVLTVSVAPTGQIIENSLVTLTCSSDANPAAKYNWYKKNEYSYRYSLSEEPQLVFSSIRSSDSGEYYCTAENGLGGGTSEHISINVKYAPKLPSVSVSPSGDVVEGRTATLSCSSDANPAATYSWYKVNPYKKLNSQGPQLVFRTIRSSDSGHYYCGAENELGTKTSKFISLNVKYAPKVPSVSVRPSAEIKEDILVTLICISDANPAAKYTWYKKNRNPERHPLSDRAWFVFSSIRSSDSGEYYCTVENELGTKTSKSISIDVKYAPKLLSVSVSPSAEIVEGSSVTLTCSSDANPAATYTWYKENRNSRVKLLIKEMWYVQLNRKQLKHVFNSIQSSDSGEYYCTAENELGRRTSEYILISVKYAPKLPSVSVSPSAEIVEGSSVTLTCSSDANPAANYSWYKENQTLLQGPEGIYYCASIRSEDSGIYYCKSENQYGQINSTSLFIDVQYAPKLPSVSVSPSAEIVEGSSVNLTCSSDANPAANYTWYKEDEDSPKASGQIFTITDFRAEHSGNYYCEAKNRQGRIKAALHLPVLAGAWKSIATATVPAVSLAIILISVFLWTIKKKASQQPSEERSHNREQIQPAEQQDELHYASVHYSKKQADPLYSNIRPAQPRRYKEKKEEEEMVVYTAVTFENASGASRTRGQEVAEDSATLYSTVNKKRNL